MARNRQEIILENIVIEAVAAEGKAIAKIDGVVLFVQFAVPGDVVDVKVTKKKKNYMEGFILRMVKPSPHRLEPFCSHFGVCGGCKWQPLPYEMQLQAKQQQVYDQLVRIGHLDVPEISPIVGSDETTYYRNKLEFTFSQRRWIFENEDAESLTEQEKYGLGFHVGRFFDKVLDNQYLVMEIVFINMQNLHCVFLLEVSCFSFVTTAYPKIKKLSVIKSHRNNFCIKKHPHRIYRWGWVLQSGEANVLQGDGDTRFQQKLRYDGEKIPEKICHCLVHKTVGRVCGSGLVSLIVSYIFFESFHYQPGFGGAGGDINLTGSKLAGPDATTQIVHTETAAAFKLGNGTVPGQGDFQTIKNEIITIVALADFQHQGLCILRIMDSGDHVGPAVVLFFNVSGTDMVNTIFDDRIEQGLPGDLPQIFRRVLIAGGFQEGFLGFRKPFFAECGHGYLILALRDPLGAVFITAQLQKTGQRFFKAAFLCQGDSIPVAAQGDQFSGILIVTQSGKHFRSGFVITGIIHIHGIAIVIALAAGQRKNQPADQYD